MRPVTGAGPRIFRVVLLILTGRPGVAFIRHCAKDIEDCRARVRFTRCCISIGTFQGTAHFASALDQLLQFDFPCNIEQLRLRQTCNHSSARSTKSYRILFPLKKSLFYLGIRQPHLRSGCCEVLRKSLGIMLEEVWGNDGSFPH